METRAHFVLIGSIVLAVIAAAFYVIIQLSNAQREYDEYDIIFTERVSGLSVGAAVRFNGIQKGEVETLSLDPVNPSIVIARVHVDRDTPVKIDTKAELELVGFTGLAIIQFVGGSTDAPLLKDADPADVPRIEADTSGLNAFLEGSGDVVAQANRLLSDEMIANFSGVVENINITTKAIADNENEIREIIRNTSEFTEDLALITAKLEKSADSLQKMLDEDGPATFEEAQAMLVESRLLIDELRGVVEENRASIKVFTDQGLGQVAPAVAEARRLMRTLDNVLREMERSPKSYLFGETAPEYKAESE